MYSSLKSIKIYSCIILLLIISSSFAAQALTGETSGLQTATNAKHTHPGNSRGNLTINLTLEDADVTYAIIAPANFTGVLSQLAEWKTQKGVRAKTYELDWIYSNFNGSDAQEQLHNFLVELDNVSKNLTWVLLAGDTEIIPIREFYVNASLMHGLDDIYPSDYYYAGLDSSWDSDNDGKYGEQSKDLDPVANVYVGRLPLNNVTNAEIAVDNILVYECTPPEGSWFNNFTIWGGLMDAPNVLDDPGTIPKDEGYNDYKDNGYKISQKILNYIPSNMKIKEYYDYPHPEGGNYTPENDTLNRTSAKTGFNDGNALLSFAGQAYYSGDELAHYRNETGTMTDKAAWSTLYSYNNAKFATNNRMLPLVYLATCSVNYTEPNDSNLEQLLTAANGGAIGVIANTGKSYRGEEQDGGSYGNWWLNERFWKLFFNDSYYRPGESLYELKYQYYNEVLTREPPYPIMVYANILGYNLLGDPELPVWTADPQQIVVELPKFYTGSQEIRIKVTNDTGSPVEGARICLRSDHPAIYETNLTDYKGETTLIMNSQSEGTVNITITAHNYLPYETTGNIESEPADLRITTGDIILGNATPSEGDKLMIAAIIYNEGNIDALDFFVECYDGDPDEAGILVDSGNFIDVLFKGHPKTIEFNWNATSGNHNIFIVVDRLNTILESDEINNKAFITFYVNARPKISELPDIELEEDIENEISIDLSQYAKDADNNFSALELTIIRVTNPNCIATITSNSSLAIRIASNWYGLAEVTVKVSDGLASSQRRFGVTVQPGPDAPVLHYIPDLDLEVDEVVRYYAEADDPDGDPLTFSDDSKLFEIDRQTGRIAFTPTEDDVGVHTVTITVSDGNLTASQTIEITITNGGEYKYISTIVIIISIIVILVIIVIYLKQSKPKEEGDEEEPRVTLSTKITKPEKTPRKQKIPKTPKSTKKSMEK